MWVGKAFKNFKLIVLKCKLFLKKYSGLFAGSRNRKVSHNSGKIIVYDRAIFQRYNTIHIKLITDKMTVCRYPVLMYVV